MDDCKISVDIYKDSLSIKENSYYISDDIAEEAENLSVESLQKELTDSFKLSGRYWIWRMGSYSFKNSWEKMYAEGEMQVDAFGLKYLLSYPTLAAIEEAYVQINPDRQGITFLPPAYYAFANYLRKGDVVIACGTQTNIIAWGIVEGAYMFKPTRSKGRHYRKMTWYKMEMPFIFTNKRPALFQIDKSETSHLKEALISKAYTNTQDSPLPFGFTHQDNDMPDII